MMLVTLFTLTLAQASPFNDALVALGRGELERGAELLQSVPPGDRDFVDALVESQKVNYRRGEWQKFFAYAKFYRGKLLANEELARRNFNARLISLEIMALAKHCLFPEARAVGEQALAQGRTIGANVDEILETLTHFHLTEAFPSAIKGQAQTKRPSPVFSRELLWPVRNDQLEMIEHPKNLRLIVGSRCES